MNISLGADHGGFNLKQQIKQYLISLGHNVLDKGTDSMDSCNYALFARAAAECVANKEADFAIVVCTSGEGVSMAANKVKEIGRAHV